MNKIDKGFSISFVGLIMILLGLFATLGTPVDKTFFLYSFGIGAIMFFSGIIVMIWSSRSQ